MFEGEAIFGINGDGSETAVTAVNMVYYEDGDHVRIQAGPDLGARFVLFAGAPFGETIVPYGPFVMNTEDEIRTALDELREGTFIKG